jgi:hypothetical protein
MNWIHADITAMRIPQAPNLEELSYLPEQSQTGMHVSEFNLAGSVRL